VILFIGNFAGDEGGKKAFTRQRKKTGVNWRGFFMKNNQRRWECWAADSIPLGQ